MQFEIEILNCRVGTTQQRRRRALKFAEEGARVIASDINIDEGNENVALIKQNGGEAVFARADVTRSADVEALIATVVDAYGQFDCACNNAGN
jgi:NAD(P)-dependent dehydrogenase (short-subunit alcohol dehydrogenase family)